MKLTDEIVQEVLELTNFIESVASGNPGPGHSRYNICTTIEVLRAQARIKELTSFNYILTRSIARDILWMSKYLPQGVITGIKWLVCSLGLHSYSLKYPDRSCNQCPDCGKGSWRL